MSDKIIPEMSVPTSVCPNPEKWSAYDNMATELEVLYLLFALVRTLKPKVIIETGCYRGHATEEMARAVELNGFGQIHTCDVGHSELLLAEQRCSNRWSADVDYKQCTGVELILSIPAPIDFAFLDSGSDEVRCDELRALYPKLSAGAVVAIHDTGIHTWLREKYLPPLLRELNMQYIFFDTPRGLTLCRKQPEIYP